MASAREVRLRIRSVKNIAQVTRALEAVSASYVRTATNAVMATRDYARRAFGIMTRLASQPGDLSMLHPLLEQRDLKRTTVVLVTSDRGLCGPYNMNVFRAATEFAKELDTPVEWIAVGRKGRDLLFRQRQTIVSSFSNFTRPPKLMETLPIARTIMDDFLSGHSDEVYIAYTDYISTVNLKPRVVKLLPFGLTSDTDMVSEHDRTIDEAGQLEYIYEPSASDLLSRILPSFTELQIYQALLESLASEHSARMVAMRNATDNASDLGDSLRLAYNKARQLAITSDILDIVGGAEALEAS